LGLGIGPGDEVIVPALTFVATANAVSLTGAALVIIDIHRDGLKHYLESQGIQTRAYYPPISSQPSYYSSTPVPVAASVAAQGLWLPAAAYVAEPIVDRVCREIMRWLLNGRL
jgi:dTDP-4-amino-4,6-dideoxygalactose transaminase